MNTPLPHKAPKAKWAAAEHDIFISYAHQGDSTSCEVSIAQVSRLHDELEENFRQCFGHNVDIFFDREDIRNFDHWQVRCHRALRSSRFFLACLSRSYLRSDACRWEWEEWCKQELEHGMVGQGAALIWLMKKDDLYMPEVAEQLRLWKGDLFRRFHVQCHESRHKNLPDSVARAEMKQLTEHVAQHLRLLTRDHASAGNLPWPNANFVGRKHELVMLREALLVKPDLLPVGLHGIGGMGKTALSEAFAYAEIDSFPSGCWLLRCEGREHLLPVFRELVYELGIELTEEEQLDDAQAVQRIFDLLRQLGPALFILDNVDHPTLLSAAELEFLVNEPWARLIYTTRLSPEEFGRTGVTVYPFDLDRLSDEQAVELIRSYQPEKSFASNEKENAAFEIVHELSGIPLAVETAAIYLGLNDSRTAEPQYAVDIRDYIHTLRSDLKNEENEGIMSQLQEVTATLRPTLARLDFLARTVLQVSSLFAPQSIALPWVRAIAARFYPDLEAEADPRQLDLWTHLIRELIGMRLLQLTSDPRIATIHSILQRVLITELPEGREVLHALLDEHIRARDNKLRLETQWIDARWELEPYEALAWQRAKHYSEKEKASPGYIKEAAGMLNQVAL